jgi:glycosyl transferase family 25
VDTETWQHSAKKLTQNIKISAHLINLKRSHERRQKMHDQLQALGIPYKLHEATDGKEEWHNLVQYLNEPAFTANVGRLVLRGEIGCYHSHLSVWKDFLTTDSDAALVMEDDVVFHHDFLEGISAAVAMYEHWDLLKLNKARAKQPIAQVLFEKWRLNSYVGPATGTGAYLIKKDLALRLQERMLPMARPIDHELDRIHVHKFRLIGLEPFPSHVDDGGDSTITGANYKAVKKFQWYKRLPVYWLRAKNFSGKILHLALSGQLLRGAKRAQVNIQRLSYAFSCHHDASAHQSYPAQEFRRKATEIVPYFNLAQGDDAGR